MKQCKSCDNYFFPNIGSKRTVEPGEVDWGGYNGDMFIYRTKNVLMIKCPFCEKSAIWKTLK